MSPQSDAAVNTVSTQVKADKYFCLAENFEYAWGGKEQSQVTPLVVIMKTNL
jgi:hypothetical protein